MPKVRHRRPYRQRAAVVAAAAALLAPAGDAGSIRFRDAAAAWGIDFRHHHGGTGQLYMIETMGSGVVVFDYDGDGDRDVFFVDSGALPGYRGETPRSRLFRNDGGRFADVTAASGIAVATYGMGATAGDADGDGDLDLYVTGFGPNQLLLNDGDGSFTDVTATAGTGDPLWSASAAFADADGDGDLDLYVTNYVDFSFDNNPICGNQERGARSYCHPEVYNPLPDRFYLNRGPGADGIVRFDDATRAAGFGDARGNGLGVAWSDFDGDGRQDLYVANDKTANFLFLNRGTGDDGMPRFEEVALVSGAALSDAGQEEAGMGIAVGDATGDGRPDLVVTHLDLETNAFYVNQGGLFLDRRFPSQIGPASHLMVGFGTAFADLDQDGDLDLVIANGHIIHNVELFANGSTYKQPNQALENLGGGRFRLLPEAGLEAVRSSRGLAVGDLDGDGDLDLAINNSNDLCEVYENVTAASGAWLQLDLADRHTANRFGIGARLELIAGGRRQVGEVRTASSYLSQNDLTYHAGIGDAAAAELRLRWPDGRRQTLRRLPAGHRLRLIAPPLNSGSAPRSGR